MKTILRLGLVAAAAVAFAAPASAEPIEYCDATYRPRCEQCVEATQFVRKCVNIGPVSGS